MKRRVTVIGDGGWGTALALVLLENGHPVTVWGPFADYIETMRRTRENAQFLPHVPLPEALQLSSDPACVADSDLVVLAMPTKYYRPVLERFAGLIPTDALVVSVAKGMDQQTHHRMSQVAEEVLHRRSVAVLSGPSHAEEVGRRIPTAVVAACRNPEVSRTLQRAFSNDSFRVYTSEDVVGVELGGGLKNVIAVAVGVSDGLGFGDNTRAALITRGLVEMTRLGCALGAKATTFSGLSGMGDLIVTCTSRLSRNRNVGERLGRGETLEQIMGPMKQAVEGVWNCASARALAHDKGIEMPITDQVYAIVHRGKNPRDAVRALMGRNVKAEMA